MCGRVRLSSDVSEIKLVFSIPPDRPAPNFPPSWNVAPTDSLLVVRYDAKAGERSAHVEAQVAENSEDAEAKDYRLEDALTQQHERSRASVTTSQRTIAHPA